MEKNTRRKPVDEVTEVLRRGERLTRKDIGDIFEAAGYSRKSIGDLMGKMRTGKFQRETGIVIELKKQGGVVTCRNLLVPPFDSNIRPFKPKHP